MKEDPQIFIGNQTASTAPNFLEPFEFALANHFDAFEWFPDKKPSGAGWDETDLGMDLRRMVRSQAQAAGIRLSVHAQWTANPLQDNAGEILTQDLQLAENLGATLLNLHFYPDQGVKAYAKAILPLLRRAAVCRCDVAIENTVETTPQQVNELFSALLQLEPALASRAGLCLDIGHANLCAATRNNYLGFLDQLEPYVPIIHVHLHENWGDTDSHLTLFSGPAGRDPAGIRGLLDRLGARRYTGSFILEQWPQPPSLLKAARDRLRHMLAHTASVPGATPCSLRQAVND
jgi:sugar phosphate isomerase/epimerase